MAWNEPPNGNNNDQDPWGNRRRKGNDGPPDLDDLFKQINEKLGKLFGGSGSGGKGGGSSSGGAGGAGFGSILGIFAVLFVAFAVYDSIYVVDESERAVVLRLGKFHSLQPPGLQFKIPFIDTIDQKVNVTEVRNYRHQASMLTGDENIVSVSMTVEYRAVDARQFALNVQSPETTLANAAESALRHVIGSATLEQALTVGRDQIRASVRERLQDYLTSYDVGIELSQLNINDTSAPSAVQDAFDDVIIAREDEVRLINEAQAYANQILPVAEGRARRQLEEAQGYREQVIARATGEANRFNSVLMAYQESPEVTRQRLYLETIGNIYARTNKVMVDVEGGGNNLLYLPLDQLRAGGGTGSTAGTSAIGSGSFNNMSSNEISNLTDQILREIDRRRGN